MEHCLSPLPFLCPSSSSDCPLRTASALLSELNCSLLKAPYVFSQRYDGKTSSSSHRSSPAWTIGINVKASAQKQLQTWKPDCFVSADAFMASVLGRLWPLVVWCAAKSPSSRRLSASKPASRHTQGRSQIPLQEQCRPAHQVLS